jgi:hypothetical protein
MNYFKFTTNETLERVQSFVTSMNNMRSEMQEFVNEQMVLIKEKEGLLDNNNLIEIDEEKTNIDDINPILEKIYSQGINSLTEQEKNELKKYAKND